MSQHRHKTDPQKSLTINVEYKNDYAIVQLNRGRANAINQEMVDDVRSTFSQLDNEESVRGVILTGQPGMFSAGLDLIELYDYDREAMRKFFIVKFQIGCFGDDASKFCPFKA